MSDEKKECHILLCGEFRSEGTKLCVGHLLAAKEAIARGTWMDGSEITNLDYYKELASGIPMHSGRHLTVGLPKGAI